MENMSTKKFEDPFAEREARRYERPIPSRELILQVMSQAEGPVLFDELAKFLGLYEEIDVESLRRRVKAMVRDGQVVRNRRGAYLPADRGDLVRGRIIAHPDGFGFLVPDEGGGDLFLSARQMRSLLHGDRALVRVIGIDRRGRKEAALLEVLERHNVQVVGRFFTEGGLGFVVPDNKRLHQDILIHPEHFNTADSGQIVIATILEQPSNHSRPIGKIVEVLGDHMAPGMEIDIAIRSHELPHVWSDAVLSEVAHFAEEVSEVSKQGRIDLRAIPLVTIDGEDAKDFDDAVYCERKGEGWRLIVAIADVSTYVEFSSALDEEARQRGNSVYFPGKVIPMLPETLSNGLCSLNPNIERLCMACEMQIDAEGQLQGYRFYQAVMRSWARLTYAAVADIVVKRKLSTRRQYTQIVNHLDDLYSLFQLLHHQRVKRGTIDFDTEETKIVFRENRKIDRILPTERNDAHKLIEECMICANVAAARFLQGAGIPTLYRIHEGPSQDKLQELREFLGELGLKLGGGVRPAPRDYAKLMESIGDRLDAHLVQTVLLRSLAQAAYSPENIGHFGLAHEAYTHFTSPIRRYPDLLVHRAILHVLNKGKPSNFEYSQNDLMAMGEHCSMTERRADDATRDAILWLKCEYMQEKLGEEFEGVISAVTSFGLFVELNEVFVEGLIHVTSLANDYYHFDPVGYRLTGERSGRMYRLGDSIRVLVVRVDLDERRIDFGLAEVPDERLTRRRYPATRRGRKK
jgi:ribonuclease R